MATMNEQRIDLKEEPNEAGTEHVDTVHNDEALKVILQYDGPTSWTDQEEKKLRRRVDLRVMPVLCMTYFLQYYDKSMLSQAAIFGLRTDLNLLVGNRYTMTAAIFYLGFVLGAYPLMYLAQRFPLERMASATVTLWGLALILTSVCSTYRGIYAQRFFLGFLESGISPMFMLIVGSFYKKDEQAVRMGIWYCMTGLSSVLSPLINYGWGQVNGGLHAWKYMYYFSGAITIAWGLLLWFILLPDPVHARGFSPRERFILVSRIRSNNAGVRNTHLKVDQIKELLTDVKQWIAFWFALLSMITNGPISSFIPIIINGFGFNTLNSLLLTVPAGAYAAILQVGVPYLAYKFKNKRTLLIFITELGTIMAALLLWLLPRHERGALLFAVIILPTYGSGYAVLMGLQIANTSGYTKRACASAALYIGYSLGNFIGPLVFREQDAPDYVPGFIVVVVTSIISAGLILAYRFYAMWCNRQRDLTGQEEAFDHAYEDDLTDRKNPQFRYTL